MPRLAAPLGSLAVVGAAFAYVGTVNPNVPGHYPACPLLAVTGLYCPGCGGLRCAHALAHGEFGTALGANALATVGLLAAVVVLVWWLVRAVADRPLRIPAPRPVHWWAIGAVVLAFSVLRNLPFGGALTP